MHLSDEMRAELERRLIEIEAESPEDAARRDLPARDAWLLGLLLLIGLVAVAIQQLA
jgi:hypothetical protein